MVVFDRVYVPFSKVGLRTVVIPDLEFNRAHGIKSDFDCSMCGKELGISWKQGPKDGMIARCPHCNSHNEFVRREV